MIKYYRLKNNLSQKYLAAKLGVSQSYISKLENNKLDCLTTDFILNLSEELNICPILIFNYIISLRLKSFEK